MKVVINYKQFWILFIQSLLYHGIVRCDSSEEWIDPFKFEVIKPTNKYDPSDPQSSNEVFIARQQHDLKSNEVLAYYKRTINMILTSVIKERTDSNSYKGRLFVDLPLEDYNFLKKFATVEIEEPLTLQKVDQILTKVFTKSTIDELSDIFIYWSDYIYFTIFNRATGVCITIISVLIVIYKLLKAKYTPYQVVIYLLLLGYFVDFIFTWKRLLQGLEIEKYSDSLKYDKLPTDCQLSEMSGWQFLLSFISDVNNCREYHKIILYDVFWDVGPLDVLTHQSRVLSGVLSNIGIAISKLVSGLMSDLPFPLNIIFLPFMMLFVLLLLWSILTYLVETHIHLNLFHVFSIQFKTNKRIRDASEERQSRKELEEIKPQTYEKCDNITHDKRKKGRRTNKEAHNIEYEFARQTVLVRPKLAENIEINE